MDKRQDFCQGLYIHTLLGASLLSLAEGMHSCLLILYMLVYGCVTPFISRVELNLVCSIFFCFVAMK